MAYDPNTDVSPDYWKQRYDSLAYEAKHEKPQGIQWKQVNEVNVYPPKGKQLLALSPEGTLHLCFWRSAYRIFDVQHKRESSSGWWWAEINLPNQ